MAATVPQAKAPATAVSPQISGASIAICYTCARSGHWSRFVGSKDLGGYNNVYEWGAGCSGGQAYRRDRNPYFCSYN